MLGWKAAPCLHSSDLTDGSTPPTRAWKSTVSAASKPPARDTLSCTHKWRTQPANSHLVTCARCLSGIPLFTKVLLWRTPSGSAAAWEPCHIWSHLVWWTRHHPHPPVHHWDVQFLVLCHPGLFADLPEKVKWNKLLLFFSCYPQLIWTLSLRQTSRLQTCWSFIWF